MNTITRRVAASALAGTGVLHLVLAPEYLAEQTYIGALFIAGGVLCLGLAARLWLVHDNVAWSAAGLIVAGMAAGFVLSRTVGLPGFFEEEWETSGIVSLMLEGGVILASIAALRPSAARTRSLAR
ncbi:MAG: hypothetical protein QOG62_654 [Thermoleophilaceae bacterium]|jgi:hypothetical protein|nr:hypothetical protein [Thermoleophilaceae bacterium]